MGLSLVHVFAIDRTNVGRTDHFVSVAQALTFNVNVCKCDTVFKAT